MVRRNKIKPKYLVMIKANPDDIINNTNDELVITSARDITDTLENKLIKSSISFGLIMMLLLWGIVPTIVFAILGIDIDKLSDTTKIICTFINDILFISILVAVYHKTLIRDFKNFFNSQIKHNLKKAICYWLIGLGIMLASNYIIAIVMDGQLAENEEVVRNMVQTAPLYMLFQLVIYAPLTEELVFRKSIRDIITNKWLFAIISGVIFGGLHAITSITDITSLLYLIPYCSLGIVFGLLYAKSDNIFSTISVHAMHNFLALVLYVIAL